MNYKRSAFIDEFIGKFLLSIICHLPPFPKSIQKETPFKNLLVIKFLGIGSIIEATPLFRALKQKYLDIPIDILTFSENKQMVESLNIFGNVFTINFRKGLFTLPWQTIRFVLTHRRKYSLLIDLEFFANFSSLVVKMLGSTYSVGFKSFFTVRNICYSCRVVFDHSSHIREIFLKFLDALYIERPMDIPLSIPFISKDKKMSVMEKFPSLKNNCLQVAININSSDLCTNRRWPETYFRKLIVSMKRDFDKVQIYLVGGKEDLPTIKNFYESLPDKSDVYITAAKLDFIEFSYALSKMSFLITSDSGPLHIAEALNVPVVGFFGPETPNLYGPKSNNSLVFYKNLFCSPCLNTYNQKKNRCSDNRCLKLISPEEVYEKIKIKFFINNFVPLVPD